jgi:hypothetical protein
VRSGWGMHMAARRSSCILNQVEGEEKIQELIHNLERLPHYWISTRVSTRGWAGSGSGWAVGPVGDSDLTSETCPGPAIGSDIAKNFSARGPIRLRRSAKNCPPEAPFWIGPLFELFRVLHCGVRQITRDVSREAT